ncbi:MAG: hypothetical protein WCT47_00435 [Betaproteobacteria bacterium]
MLIHKQAPAYPGYGQACNGCGLCCLWRPCPLGVAITRKVRGPCRALVWSPLSHAYRCGLLTSPRRFVRWLPASLVQRVARRWIAAGAGCDAELQRLDAEPQSER